jgi:hypothetical protein
MKINVILRSLRVSDDGEINFILEIYFDVDVSSLAYFFKKKLLMFLRNCPHLLGTCKEKLAIRIQFNNPPLS